jgi:hypothetical protein
MAYVGNAPAVAYTNTVKDTFSGDGSTVAFTLSVPSTTNNVRVVVENVIQDPTVAYGVSGTTLTFTSAPPSGTDNIYVVHLGPAVQTVQPPTQLSGNFTLTGDLAQTGDYTLTGAASVSGSVTAASFSGDLPAADLTGDVAAARITNALNASGSAPIFACRAWVNFNGAGTLSENGTGNVSSVTDNGTGDYTVNFSTAMTDSNYAVAGLAEQFDSATSNTSMGIKTTSLNGSPVLKSTSAVRILNQARTGSEVDSSDTSIVIFR